MSDTYTLDPQVDTAAPSDPAPAAAPAAPAAATRAKPSDLEGDLKAVLDGIVTGATVLPTGKQATPHVLAGLIEARRGGQDRPSSGAVAAAMARWATIGYIAVTEGPTAFSDYTDAGRSEGLAALKKAHRERLSAARAADKAAAAPAPAVEPDPAPVMDPAPVVDTDAPF